MSLGPNGLEHTDDHSSPCASRDGIPLAVSDIGNDVPRCDFCNNPNPTVLFDAVTETYASMIVLPSDQDHQVDTLTEEFDPVWAACDACAVLVRARDPHRLAIRAVHNIQRQRQEQVPPEVVDAVEDIYQSFLSVWAGTERRIDAQTFPE